MSRIIRTLAIGSLVQLVWGGAVHAETVVKWDSLRKLDELAEKCEAWCEQREIAKLRKIAPQVKATAEVVAADKLPKGAKLRLQVKFLQGDLKSLAASITNPDQQAGEELLAILAGLHPVVVKLMEAAGVPHVHEGEEPQTK